MNCRSVLRLRPALQRWIQPSRCQVTAASAPEGENVEGMNIEKSINQVNLLGRVGADPQKRGTEQNPVIIFSLATHLNYRYETGDLMQKTEWHRICVFKPSLRNTVYEYLHKGQRVYVTGRITYGEIKDDAGNTRPTTAVVADEVVFLQDGKGKGQ